MNSGKGTRRRMRARRDNRGGEKVFLPNPERVFNKGGEDVYQAGVPVHHQKSFFHFTITSGREFRIENLGLPSPDEDGRSDVVAYRH